MGISHLDGLEHVRLLLQLLFLDLEILDSVCKIRSLDLLPSEVLDFMRRLGYIFPAEVDQAQVLLEVLLLSHDPRFFYLQRFHVFQLDFCLFAKDLSDDLLEVVVNLSHDFDLAVFHLLPQIVSLVKQEFSSATECLQVLHHFLAILL